MATGRSRISLCGCLREIGAPRSAHSSLIIVLSASAVVSAQSGRVYSINVTTAGATTGAIYDSSTVSGAGATNLIFVVPNTVGVTNLNFPFTNGLVYVPGTSQVASISYS